MQTQYWILIMIYFCINCFYTGAEWSNNGYTIWFLLGFLLFVPMTICVFLFYLIKMILGFKL